MFCEYRQFIQICRICTDEGGFTLRLRTGYTPYLKNIFTVKV